MSKKVVIPFKYAFVSSVVPKITKIIKRIFLDKNISKRLNVLGQNFKIPIRHRYPNMKNLGSDRLVNIYGAVRLHRFPLLIIDYGTAITCDYVSGDGVYRGGLILPGPEISLEALSKKAALLPQVPFPKKASSLLGRNTREAMQLGVLQGVRAMTDGLVIRFKRRYGRRLKVVATGGLSRRLYPLTEQIDILDPLLTLRSLALAFLEFGPPFSPLDRVRDSQ